MKTQCSIVSADISSISGQLSKSKHLMFIYYRRHYISISSWMTKPCDDKYGKLEYTQSPPAQPWLQTKSHVVDQIILIPICHLVA